MLQDKKTNVLFHVFMYQNNSVKVKKIIFVKANDLLGNRWKSFERGKILCICGKTKPFVFKQLDDNYYDWN